MKVIYKRCAGLDVHKKTVVACRIIIDEDLENHPQETRTFKTMTKDILLLSDWLKEGGITHVAMESTGSYWKPIFNILESEFEVILVNARHIKHVPGRKTDVKDAEWIAQLLQHGLLKASYIPEVSQRALRDLVRYRTKLVQERSREINRVQKVLEDANIKLSSVVSDVMGVSARAMLTALVNGQEDPETIAQLAKGRMRSKIAELEEALTGRMAHHHRLMLSLHLEHIDGLNAKIERLQNEIDQSIIPFNQNQEVQRLDGIPGVGLQVAQVIIAELGINMGRFPSSGHATSWAALHQERTKAQVETSQQKA